MSKEYFELLIKPEDNYELFLNLILSLTDDAIEENDGEIIVRSEESLEDFQEQDDQADDDEEVAQRHGPGGARHHLHAGHRPCESLDAADGLTATGVRRFWSMRAGPMTTAFRCWPMMRPRRCMDSAAATSEGRGRGSAAGTAPLRPLPY